MNEREYLIMFEQEATHWWYRGLRDMLTRLVQRYKAMLPLHPHILDIGCGTGENLRLLNNLLHPAKLSGFDIAPLALEFARTKVSQANLYQGDLRAPQHVAETLDLVLSCDAISMTGAAAAVTGLQSIVQQMSHTGIFVLHLPAYDWLRGAHDTAVHTVQRFSLQQTREMMMTIGLRPLMLSYRVHLPFLPIAAMRLWSRLKNYEEASDVHPVNPIINHGLYSLLSGENALIMRGVQLPWGVSVVGVGTPARS